ncbi:hypothetical protein RGUI_1652 [Rhodovulum sp. P5]|nr:hypothetical protein RGUI_1652 [Rhodovulum sp. P5]
MMAADPSTACQFMKGRVHSIGSETDHGPVACGLVWRLPAGC